MGFKYFSGFHPTFTQGLILGQLSIILLLFLILKFVFLESTQKPLDTFSYQPRADYAFHTQGAEVKNDGNSSLDTEKESAVWLNVLLQQIVDVYRSKLRDGMVGVEGDEIARIRVEDYANKIAPGFLDHIKIHSVNLGTSVPQILNAQLGQNERSTETSFEAVYKDNLSVSLSTAYLFNYPISSFARLPVSVTISLSRFQSVISIVPPALNATSPAVTLSISPDFILDLTTTSLMGSRGKLANVPKLHELIEHHVRNTFATQGTWKVVLPGLQQ